MDDPVADAVVTITPSGFTPLEHAARKTPTPRKPGRKLLIACLALFALAMLFLSSARSLKVVVDAQSPTQVSVSGLALPLGRRYLLLPGEYQLRVTADGYQPLATSVTVDERESQTVELKLQALPGLVSIASTPAGATVTVDDRAVGKTPLLDLPLAAGEHRLQVEEARHLPLTQSLTVTGRNVRQQLQLELAPAWAMLSMDSLPPGATILLDGEAAGTTPATVEVLQGEHQLTLQLPAFADWQQTLNIKAGADQDLGRVSLLPAAGQLALSSVPSGANVTLDGEFQGQTPLTLEVSPGRKHQLAVSRAGYQHYDDTVEMPAASRDSRTVTLKAQLGEVRINVSPANASVRIDGKVVGTGSRSVSLPAVEHTVEISLDGYASVQRRVTPRPGLAQLVEVTLQTQQQVVATRIKGELTTSLGQTLRLFKPAESALADFTLGASRREPGRRANEVLQPVALRQIGRASCRERV